jgi:uncharacterized protein (TIGR03437 family)
MNQGRWKLRLALLLAAAAACAQQQRYELPLLAQNSDMIVLTPQQAQGERVVVIDAAESALIQVLTNSATMQMTLVDPAGAEFVPRAAGGALASSARVPFRQGAAAADSFVFNLVNPAPGSWKVRVSEPPGFTGVRVAIVQITTSSDLVAALAGADRDYPLGRTIRLALLVGDSGGPLPAGAVTAVRASSKRKTAASSSPLAFRDDGAGGDTRAGDGVWTASFTPGEAGDYSLAAAVEGSRNGQPFVRRVAGRIRVTAGCGTLARTVASRAIDGNGNQRPDALEVSFNLTLARNATVHLAAELSASNGNRTLATAESSQAAGARTVAVRFDLPALRALESDPPFNVSLARMSCVEGDEVLVSDEQRDLGAVSAAFPMATAERRAIEPTGALTDLTVDTNANRKWDRLDVGVGLDLLAAGTYQWSAALYTPAGTRIASASGSGALAAGKIPASLSFDGAAIGRGAADGPFTVRGFVISGPGGAAMSIPRAGSTKPYLFDEFEGAPARPTGPSIRRGGIGNGASFQPLIARGTIASIVGAGFATTPVSAQGRPLPFTLGAVEVTVAGVPAPLFDVYPEQINFQAPFEAPLGTVEVVVKRNGVASAPEQATVVPYVIGVFIYPRAGVFEPYVVHSATNEFITAGSPAAVDEYIVIYGTGIGDLDNFPPTGGVATASPLSQSRVLPVVTLGGVPLDVIFAGLTPGQTGLVQINAKMPARLPAGARLPLIVQVGTSSHTVTLAVR